MKPLGLTIVWIILWAGVIQAATPIAGCHHVDAATLTKFVMRHNPDFDPEIAEAFIETGDRYGIRGDIAFCQAILETGWFRFDKGTAVTPEMHNYCGLGVMSRGDKGCEFATVGEGVEAMLQHLYAYCCADPLPEGSDIVDPRFKLVARGCAATWEDLSGRWAANPYYGANILAIYNRVAELSPVTRVEVIEVDIPDEFYFSDD